MTVQKAIDWLKVASAPFHNKDKRTEAINTAIKCMEELEQYRALGTVEEIIKHRDNLEQENHEYSCLGTVEELKEAMEKQIAKKPTFKGDFIGFYECKCGALVEKTMSYCCECGKKLDWSEEDD